MAVVQKWQDPACIEACGPSETPGVKSFQSRARKKSQQKDLHRLHFIVDQIYPNSVDFHRQLFADYEARDPKFLNEYKIYLIGAKVGGKRTKIKQSGYVYYVKSPSFKKDSAEHADRVFGYFISTETSAGMDISTAHAWYMKGEKLELNESYKRGHWESEKFAISPTDLLIVYDFTFTSGQSNGQSYIGLIAATNKDTTAPICGGSGETYKGDFNNLSIVDAEEGPDGRCQCRQRRGTIYIEKIAENDVAGPSEFKNLLREVLKNHYQALIEVFA